MSRGPSYRKRKGYSQALVTLTDSVTKRRRDYWLGEYDTPKSREKYHRVIAAWYACGKRWPELEDERDTEPDAPKGGLTITILIEAYWRHAEEYYQPNESGTLRVALRLLRAHFGSLPAEDFGPKRLRDLREAMITGDPNATPPRPTWSRKYTNQQVQRIRRMFRWAASHEMIAADVHRALETVESLKRGRTRAREGKRVLPAPPELIEAVRPFLSRQVNALIDLQLLTGARPGELMQMRPVDLERDIPSDVLMYRPREHKNQFRGIERVIYLGPRAQEVIEPFLTGRAADAYLFSPTEAEAERRAAIHAARKTPLSCGNRPGTNRVERAARSAGDHYTTPSYYVAIRRACDRAFPPPGALARRDDETVAAWRARLTSKQREELKEWQREHRWHPHQLRHNAATSIRSAFGLEESALVLGHSSAVLTDAVYAERDERRVLEVMREVG